MKTVNDYVEKMVKNSEIQRKAELPSEYELKRIQECVNGLFSFARFKQGQTVQIAKNYPVNLKDSPGWAHIRHLLIEGALWTVKEVDFYNSNFYYLIESHDKTWIDDKGKTHEASSTSSISLEEEWITEYKNVKPKKKAKVFSNGDRVRVYGRETHGEFTGVGNIGTVVGLHHYVIYDSSNEDFYDIDMGNPFRDHLTFHANQLRKLVKKGKNEK